MVMDSLRYWVTAFHVDGFRFDLGVTLGREDYGFDPGSGFFDAIRQDPVLSRVKLISEPWDLGPGGYQLGNHPPGFAEWNDRFRDGVRRYWRGDAGQRADFAARLAGSGDMFDRRGRRPWASINFVAAHDGFTLADTVSYAERHNEANGEDNKDGHGRELLGQLGRRGPDRGSGDPRHARRVQRAMLATLFLAQGTPMLLAGDEFGRTQHGNNNAYCQDNETSWLDWTQADGAEGSALTDFVERIIALRHQPCGAALRQLLARPGRAGAGHPRHRLVREPRARPISHEAWNNPRGATLVLRRAGRNGDGSVSILTASSIRRRRITTSAAAARLPARAADRQRPARCDPSAISTARTIVVEGAQRRADAAALIRKGLMSGFARNLPFGAT